MPDDHALDTMKFAIGQPVLRSEDARLLTGGGLFTDDTRVDGEAQARFVRSPIAHARISGILRLAKERGTAGDDADLSLLDHDADPNLAGEPWATPLGWTERNSLQGIVMMLKDRGATA